VVLLFPYTTTIEGQKAYDETPLGSTRLPATTWNEDKTTLTVKLSNQVDVYTFQEQKSGRRSVFMIRNGVEILR
jgi:hypothetical protein